ncbi:MAG: XdhC family protein [Bacteroidota bacterium]
MREFYESVARRLEGRDPFVIATIVRVAGSSPRDPGAKIVVLTDGRIEGTLGGGKLEAQVIRDAAECLGNGGPALRSYSLSEEGLGMKCGGRVDVFFEPVRSRDRLVVFGGGHVGRAVARLAPSAGFAVEVVDDRPEHLASEGLPEGVRLVATDSGFREGYEPLGPRDYAVIVTRDAATDAEIAGRHAGRCAYVGVMGSRAKRAFLERTLAARGIATEDFARIRCPMGVDIGSDTPDEIAVSVLAEMIGVRAARRAPRRADAGPPEGRPAPQPEGAA